MKMMTDADVHALVQGFEECTLTATAWTHAAHLTVALWYLRTLNRSTATDRIRSGIQRLNRAIGVRSTGYHETITLAWIALVANFLSIEDHGQSIGELVTSLIAQHPSDALQRYYTPEVLMSPDARVAWVPPDRIAFDDGVERG